MSHGPWGSPAWGARVLGGPQGGGGGCSDTKALPSWVSRFVRGSRAHRLGRSGPELAPSTPPGHCVSIPVTHDGRGGKVAGGRGRGLAGVAAQDPRTRPPGEVSGPRWASKEGSLGRERASGEGGLRTQVGLGLGAGLRGLPRVRPFPARPDWAACVGSAPHRPRPPSENSVSATS